MEKVVSKTVDVLSRFGEKIERRLSTGDNVVETLERSESGSLLDEPFGRPLDGYYPSKHDLSRSRSRIYDSAAKYSSDNLAASPGYYGNYNGYGQNFANNLYPNGMIMQNYGAGAGYVQPPVQQGYVNGYNNFNNYARRSNNVAYAPDYYVAERRQIELVPAPPPRYIQQPVPVPVPVDRPVPQPYPVEVPRPVPVDRPVPVRIPVPSPVPVDRPVPVLVPVPVPSPPPPPVQIPVPVPVPSPVPFYVPVSVPVPSPPPSPVMVENSVTHTQRWITSSPAMMNQQRYLAGSPAMGMNPCVPYNNGVLMR